VPVSPARACADVADGRSVEVRTESRLFNTRTRRHKDGVVVDGQNLVPVCLHGEILSIWVRGTKMCLWHAYNEVHASKWKNSRPIPPSPAGTRLVSFVNGQLKTGTLSHPQHLHRWFWAVVTASPLTPIASRQSRSRPNPLSGPRSPEPAMPIPPKRSSLTPGKPVGPTRWQCCIPTASHQPSHHKGHRTGPRNVPTHSVYNNMN